MRMYAMIGAVLLYVLTATTVQPQGAKDSQILGTKERAKQKDFEQGGANILSAKEQALVERARAGNVTASEKTLANDICGKKCRICFDGVACNFDCAAKYCSK